MYTESRYLSLGKEPKKVLTEWMGDNSSPFDQVVAALTSPEMTRASKEVLSPADQSITDEEAIDPLDLKATTLPLLYQLHKRRALPAILFNYDRERMRGHCFHFIAQLITAEAKWKEGPQWKK